MVEFIDTRELAVVQSQWMRGECVSVWPPFRSPTQIQKVVVSGQTPGEKWVSYSVKCLYESESYEKVRMELRVAEEQSVLATTCSSEDDGVEPSASRHSRRRKRSPDRYSDMSDHSESETDIELQTLKRKRSGPSPTPPTPVRRSCPLPSLPVRRQLEHLQSDSHLSPVNAHPMPQSPLGSPAPSQTDRSRDARLFQILEELRQGQFDCLSAIRSVIRRLGDGHDEGPELPDDITFPIKSLGEVESFETSIEDTTTEKAVVRHLAGIVRRMLSVRRMFSHAMANPLAVNYNWLGKKGKRCFSELKLKGVLMKAVRKNFSKATENEVERVVKEWLRNAKARDGGRARRQNPQVAPEKSN